MAGCPKLLLLLCLSAQALSAQNQSCEGSSQVTHVAITDAHGAMIPDAAVTYTCGVTTEHQTSDAAGVVALRLAPGSYTLHVEAPGFQPTDRPVLIQSTPAELTLALDVHSAEEGITVSAEHGPVVSATDIGTRTETALRDIPQSLQIVSRQVLDQQQTRSLNDVLRNVAGVTIPWTSGGRYESITIRGFTTMNQFKDGFRNDPSSNRAPIELSNVERVEVLKGPSSMVFGRLDPAGVVNVVTRAPSTDRSFTATLTSGSFQYNRVDLDFTGPVNRSKSLLYRVTGSGLDTLSFRNYAYTKRGFVASALTWIPQPSLSIRFYSEFLIQNSVNDQGIVAVGNRPADIPISTYLGDPKLTAPDRQGKVGISVDKALSNGWILRSYERSSVGVSIYNSRTATSLAKNNRTLTLNDSNSEQNIQSHYWINEAVGRVHTGKLEHLLLAGFELDREINPNYAKVGVTTPTIDIYAPNYAALPVRVLRLSQSNNSDAIYGGGYVQDQLKLTNFLKITGGIRYDIAKSITDTYYPNALHVSGRNTAWSPRAGLVFQPVRLVSLYATYAKSFQPQVGTTFAGSPFSPTVGRLLETGVRLTSPKELYVATVSAYNITQTNVLTTDPVNSGYSVTVGEQRSKGIDFDSTVRLNSNWNVIAGYAYDIPQVTRDNTYAVGNLLAGAARHTGNLWTHYTSKSGPLRGIGAGAGVFGSGKRQGDLANDYLVPGYARVDVNASYVRSLREDRKLTFNFNIQNVGDRRYFEGASTRNRIAPGAPRTYVGSIQFTR